MPNQFLPPESCPFLCALRNTEYGQNRDYFPADWRPLSPSSGTPIRLPLLMPDGMVMDDDATLDGGSDDDANIRPLASALARTFAVI